MSGRLVQRLALAFALTGSLVVGLACGGGGSGGSGGSSDSSTPSPKGAQAHDAQLLEGRRVYIDNCVRCHGPAGRGGVGPRLAGKVTTAFPVVADQVTLVENGKGIMPAWKGQLTTAQIQAVVRYTREVL